jgi:6-hydroxycyclohex-1-ene-1-carbonyl-CoA dehydrogenase
MRKAGAPLGWEPRDERCAAGEAIVEVAGCGVCHTDLGFYAGGVPTRHALPLTLGHEVSGRVVEAGAGAEEWLGAPVIVPAVIPCAECAACRAGRGAVCPKQVFPGNDVHGGFATHLRVPARGLCRVPDLSDARVNPRGLHLSDLSVIADAISTPYQAVVQSRLGAGDLAVFVGAGGVGGFGVQVAAARGAAVLAIDPSEARRALVAEHGASATIDPGGIDARALAAEVRSVADARGIPTWRWRLFETSGTPAGQTTAFRLLAPGAHLSIVGYTPEKVEVRLSNVMALDATIRGTWGCDPALYPAVLSLVLAGEIALTPFVEHRPLAAIQRTFEDLQAHRLHKRVVLVPER